MSDRHDLIDSRVQGIGIAASSSDRVAVDANPWSDTLSAVASAARAT